MEYAFHHGPCLDQLKQLPDESVDLLLTDPPYGLHLLDKDWDRAVPSVEEFAECLRVLKPGAIAFVMSHQRLDLQIAMGLHLKQAGFEIGFTPIWWTYATGYSKAKNLGKKDPLLQDAYSGFNPKPAVEVVIVAAKPLAHKTYMAQAQDNGKGVLRTAESRIPGQVQSLRATRQRDYPKTYKGDEAGWGRSRGGHAGDQVVWDPHAEGRFPANLIVSDSVLGEYSQYFDLDAWSNARLPFLHVKRPTRAERQRGCEHIEGGNDHVSVKPIKLMAWLMCLASQPGDVVLDPYMGSGTTLVAAKLMGRNAIGMDKSARSVEIAKARVAAHERL